MTPLDRLLADPPDLPIVSGLDELASLLTPGRALVLSAPPGSGKTTLLPPLLASRLGGSVLVAEPRRIAARAAARRLAALLGEKVGLSIGYSVKGETRRSAATRVEFLTPGVLIRRIQSDPSLEGVSAVLLDEFHERHLDSDLALGLLADARAVLREDLHLSVASATLDAEAIRALLSTLAPTDALEVPGAAHPLSIRYAPPPRGVVPLEADRSGTVRVPRAFLAHVARCALDGLAASSGDLLVIVPGVREIDEVAARLRSALAEEETGTPLDVLPLHGSLPAREQDRVLTPRSTRARRIVVATPVAESSLTVPGVDCVIDSGLAREPRLDLARGAGSLITVRAARARCEQRAGRAARLGPGLAIRCFEEVEWAKRPAQALPEILVADLADAALQGLCWSPEGLAGLPLLDPPPPAALAAALSGLEALGLVQGGRILPLGEKVAHLPLDPAIGAALLTSAPRVGAARAARSCALLSEGVRVPDADLAAFAKRLPASDRALAARIDQQAKRLSRPAAAAETESADTRPLLGEEDALALVVARARPRWIARSRSGGRSYLFADGQAALLPQASPLEGAAWLAVAEVTRSASADGLIRAAVPIDEADALELGAPMITRRREVGLENGRIRARSTRALGAIPLGTPQLVDASPEEALAALIDAFHAHGLGILEWSEAATALRARINALHGVDPRSWPAVDDASLIEAAPRWLGADLPALAAGRPLATLNTAAALHSLLEWNAASRLDALAPGDITIPTGARRRIDWSSGRPVLALRVQEAFGWTDSPVFAEGRLPLVLHLTDPAGRPAAVTSDLASFWAGPYQEVRSQLRGRYPKHPWPEDPFSERPTSRAKPRR